jgi:glycosyltransferase involved in cell wall biosynthesis
VIKSIGVVVPAHDEEKLLPSCLASLRRAARSVGLPVYLVVVADACRDQTPQVARRGGAAVVTIDAGNVGAARAEGVREVLRRTGRLDPAEIWLATTDADTQVPACWLRAQVRYGNRGWDAVVGAVRVTDWAGHRPAVRSLFRERYGTGASGHSHVHGANLGFRAAAYLAAGGFPDRPTAEDHALVESLTSGGSRVLRTSAVTVVTSARRAARAPHGFSGYLRELEAEVDASLAATARTSATETG